MTPYDFVHLAFLAIDSGIKGNTKLQKTIYFLSVLLGKAKQMGYRPHYYGPYSDAVAAAVSKLVSLDFLEKTSFSYGNVNSRGFEVARHDYCLTDAGRQVAQRKAAQFPEEYRALQQRVGALKMAGDIDYMEMSIAAKTYYMLEQAGKPANPAELSQAARRLGWNPTETEICESFKFLKALSLVS